MSAATPPNSQDQSAILALEEALASAKEKFKQAWNGSIAEYRAAGDIVSQCERNLASAKGEPYAVPCELPIETRRDDPIAFQNSRHAFWILHTDEGLEDEAYYASYRANPDRYPPERFVVVEFDGCICMRGGLPGEDDSRKHPLHGKGLEFYEFCRVENSRWVEDVRTACELDTVHPRADFGGELQHYFYLSESCTLECLARGFKYEVRDINYFDLREEIETRMTR